MLTSVVVNGNNLPSDVLRTPKLKSFSVLFAGLPSTDLKRTLHNSNFHVIFSTGFKVFHYFYCMRQCYSPQHDVVNIIYWMKNKLLVIIHLSLFHEASYTDVVYKIVNNCRKHIRHCEQHYSGRSRGGRGPCPQSRKIMMMGNGRLITGCLIHRVAKYSGFKDACFPVLPFRKEICHYANRITSGILWLLSLAAAQEVTGQRQCHQLQCA